MFKEHSKQHVLHLYTVKNYTHPTTVHNLWLHGAHHVSFILCPLQETPAQCRAALKHKFISMHRHSLSVCGRSGSRPAWSRGKTVFYPRLPVLWGWARDSHYRNGKVSAARWCPGATPLIGCKAVFIYSKVSSLLVQHWRRETGLPDCHFICCTEHYKLSLEFRTAYLAMCAVQ